MARRDSVAWRWLRLLEASRKLLAVTCGACDDAVMIQAAREALDAALGDVDAVVTSYPECDACGGPHPDEDCKERWLWLCPKHGPRMDGIGSRRYYRSSFNSYEICNEGEAPGVLPCGERVERFYVRDAPVVFDAVDDDTAPFGEGGSGGGSR
jgi:hypothetical protein